MLVINVVTSTKLIQHVIEEPQEEEIESENDSVPLHVEMPDQQPEHVVILATEPTPGDVETESIALVYFSFLLQTHQCRLNFVYYSGG